MITHKKMTFFLIMVLLVFTIAGCKSDGSSTSTTTPGSDKSIQAFSFARDNNDTVLTNDYMGKITDGSISVTLPYGTPVTSLVPTVVINGKTVSPGSNEARDFSSPVTYTVTAEDGSTKDYVVTVSIAPSDSKEITYFAFTAADNGFPADVSASVYSGTVDIRVPYGTDLTSLVPAITSTGIGLSPASGTARDFSSPVTYTVTAADGSTNDYTVNVSVYPADSKDITGFVFRAADNSFAADVYGSQSLDTINVQVPWGTDVTSLVPTISVSGTGVSPAGGTAQDFSSPVSYTVTAGDGSTKTYTVNVSMLAASSDKDITAFNFKAADNPGLALDILGTVNTDTVTVTVPFGTDLAGLKPSVTITGDAISPPGGIPRDFSSPLTYTVVAQDGSSKDYTVTVSVAASGSKEITGFSFKTVSNPSLSADVYGSVSSGVVSLVVPYGTDLTALTPSITTSGSAVSPASGTTGDFSSPASYAVTAQDGSTKSFLVNVSASAPKSDKDISSFNFKALDNTALSVDILGDVGATAVTLTVPYGTDVTALAPVIVTTGESISPASGVSRNFSSPQTYTVTAQDGSTQSYTVTVNTAPSDEKIITGFNFTATDNPALSADVFGVVGTGSVDITVPPGTDVTALTPSIMISGSSVSPATGAAQDFSSPVSYTVTAADGSTRSYTVTVTVDSGTSSKEITGFKFTAAENSYIYTDAVAEISGTSITVSLPYGIDVTSLSPSVTFTGASISPASMAAQDFSSPVTYTITAGDGTTETYMVTVTVDSPTGTDILSFSLPAAGNPVLGADINGKIGPNKIILSTTLGAADLTSLVPAITVPAGSTISPASGTAQDFTSPVVYTVTDTGGAKKYYLVYAGNPQKNILTFTFRAADNPSLTGDLNGTVMNDRIYVFFPYGLDRSSLVPTITTNGVYSMPESGIARDFSSPVTYKVLATDESIKRYVVTDYDIAQREEHPGLAIRAISGDVMVTKQAFPYIYIQFPLYERIGGTWTFQKDLGTIPLFEDEIIQLKINSGLVAMSAAHNNSVGTGINGDETPPTGSYSNTTGAVWVVSKNGSGEWVKEAFIKGSNTESGDQFGRSIALDGNTLVVGATGESSPANGVGGEETNHLSKALDSGAVYVFVRDGAGNWTQQAYIKAMVTANYLEFGQGVAISGDLLAVSDSLDNIWLYERDGSGTWSYTTILKVPGYEDGDSGINISYSRFQTRPLKIHNGNMIMIGSPMEDSGATGVNGDSSDNSVAGAGAAYLFTKDSLGNWNFEAYFKAFNPDPDDRFGTDFALSDNMIAIGAPQEDGYSWGINGDMSLNSTYGSPIGAEYLYIKDIYGNWSPYAYLKPQVTSTGDFLDFQGSSLVISGRAGTKTVEYW